MSRKYLDAARKYREKFNFKLIPLHLKEPVIRKLETIYNNEQSDADIKKIFKRDNVTGLGIVLGNNNLQALDLDGVKEFNIVVRILEILELGKEYPFVVKTANGYHIYFYCDYSSDPTKRTNKAFEIYEFIDLNKGKQLEYRKERCYVVAPTSQHPSGMTYEFINGLPKDRPGTVNIENIYKAIFEYCESKERIIKNIIADSRDPKYLQRAVKLLKKNKLNYSEWISVLFALASLGEAGREPFITLSTNEFYPEDDLQFLNDKFDYALAKFDSEKIKFNTLFYIAKKYGMQYIEAEELSKQFLEFELCALSYPMADQKEKLIMIRDYAMIRKSQRIDKIGGKKIKMEFDKRITAIKSAEIEKNYELISNHVKEIINLTGKQPYCRIGEDFFDETINGKFDYLTWAILASIYAIQGKTDRYKRITKDRMALAVLGYKDKRSFELVGKNEVGISEYKIRNRVHKLRDKNIISFLTVMGRYSYYSTYLKQEELRKVIQAKWEKQLEKQHHISYQQEQLNIALSAKKATLRITKFNKIEVMPDNTASRPNMEFN